jgi:hypothetical protein
MRKASGSPSSSNRSNKRPRWSADQPEGSGEQSPQQSDGVGVFDFASPYLNHNEDQDQVDASSGTARQEYAASSAATAGGQSRQQEEVEAVEGGGMLLQDQQPPGTNLQNQSGDLFFPQGVGTSLPYGLSYPMAPAAGFMVAMSQHHHQFMGAQLHQTMNPQGMISMAPAGGMNAMSSQAAVFIPGVGLVSVVNPGTGRGMMMPGMAGGVTGLVSMMNQQQRQQQPCLMQQPPMPQQLRLQCSQPTILQQPQQLSIQQQQRCMFHNMQNPSGAADTTPTIQQDQHIHPHHLRPHQGPAQVLQQHLAGPSDASAGGSSEYSAVAPTSGQDSDGAGESQRRVSLHIQTDNDVLSDYQILLRQSTEFFEATRKDLDTITPGRKKPIVLGQVGIRCIHCVSNPIYRRTSASVYFPAKLRRLYQSAQNIGLTHFEQSCEKISDELRNKLKSYHNSGKKAAAGHGGKEYWTTAAKALGIVETDNGLIFHGKKQQGFLAGDEEEEES